MSPTPGTQNSWTPGLQKNFVVNWRRTIGQATFLVRSTSLILNLPGEDGKLLIDPALLQERLAGLGIIAPDPVVAYCRSGVRAALSYLAMKQAGYNVRLYDGSFAEWMDSDHPVAV